MMERASILLVEDDDSLGFLVKDTLDGHGWDVHLFRHPEKALASFFSNQYDLCVLDVMLPDKDGFDVAEQIRRYNHAVPIVFLTARSQTEDRIRGFRVGADDYVCKPFSIEELKYRIDAILKRSSTVRKDAENHTLLTAGNSSLDVQNMLLNANGTMTRLTYKECKLLQLFFRHAGALIERDVFLKSIWEEDGFFVARSMDVFVSRLRRYLREDDLLRIDNIRGVGYILRDANPGKSQPATVRF
jgi:DNA-binding response OmpR family regulator